MPTHDRSPAAAEGHRSERNLLAVFFKDYGLFHPAVDTVVCSLRPDARIGYLSLHFAYRHSLAARCAIRPVTLHELIRRKSLFAVEKIGDHHT
jgi:hypothetical protein